MQQKQQAKCLQRNKRAVINSLSAHNKNFSQRKEGQPQNFISNVYSYIESGERKSGQTLEFNLGQINTIPDKDRKDNSGNETGQTWRDCHGFKFL